MHRCARWIAVLALVLAGFDARPGEAPHVSLVPWKILEPGTDVKSPLVLFWIPASRDEVRRSDLLTSDELTLFASQCVAMRVVRFDDAALRTRLETHGALPIAVLTDAEGNVLTRVDNRQGVLVVEDVERMVRKELERRVTGADTLLDQAREKAEAGDNEAAIAMYRAVWDQRCVCPRQGRDAQKALRKLKAR